MTVGLEAHHAATDHGVHGRQVQLEVRYVSDLHVGDGGVSEVQTFSDDLLTDPGVVVEGGALRAFYEQLAVVRGQGNPDRTDLTDRHVSLLGPHAITLTVGDVNTPLVNDRYTETDGGRFARHRRQLNPVDLVIAHGILDGFDVVPSHCDTGFLHGHNSVQDVALHHLLDVLTVHLLDGRLAHRLVTDGIHLWVVVRLLQSQVIERDLQRLFNSQTLGPRVLHGLVGVCQALHAAILRCRHQFLVNQFVDLRLDGAGQGVLDVGGANDLQVLFLFRRAFFNDQFTVFVREDGVIGGLGWSVERFRQLLFLVHQQLICTGLSQQLLFGRLIFFLLGSSFFSLSVSLLFYHLFSSTLDSVGLVDHLGQHLQETKLDDLGVQTLRGFHRDIDDVLIEGVIAQCFHRSITQVGLFEVELRADGLLQEGFSRHTCASFTPAVQLTEVQGDEARVPTDKQIDLVEVRVLQPVHRSVMAILTQPHEEVEQIQTFAGIENLHQSRGHATFCFTQIGQGRQGVRYVEDDDVVTFV
ncbi:hypothetical protein D3C78_578260 [compost metagenome]